MVDRRGPFDLRLQPQKQRIPSPWGVEGDMGLTRIEVQCQDTGPQKAAEALKKSKRGEEQP